MLIDFENLNLDILNPETDFEAEVIGFVKEMLSDSAGVKVQTSGSTGVPKVFDVEKSRMFNSAKITCDFLQLKPGDSALLCLPISYISGKMMVVRSMQKHLKLWIIEPSTKPIQDLQENVTFCAMTPLQVENSLDKIHLIEKLIIGGAAVSESLKKKIFQTLQNSNSQTNIYETYGMSETLSHIALKEIYPQEEEYFKIFESVEISKDERGCLKIYAPQLNPEILQTNDIIELKNEKQFRFLGRADHIINSGGAKIYPEELEKIVKQNIANEVVFVGLPDESLGRKLILIVEGQEDEELTSQILQIQFEKSFHKPKGIIFVDEIPRTPNGKINRLELLKNFS